MIDGVVFDWGGTLTRPIEVIYEIDTWGEVARHLDPENHEELVIRLGAIEAELWEISRTTQKSAHLEDLIAAVVAEFGIEMAEDSLRYATGHHLDAILPHIEHDPDAALGVGSPARAGAQSRPLVEHSVAGGVPRAPAGGSRHPGSDRRASVHESYGGDETSPAGFPRCAGGAGHRRRLAAPSSSGTVRSTTSMEPSGRV